MANWTPYLVIFKLLSPMHVGWRKIGNLQQTRPYVIGKTMWGAMTACLANQTIEKDYKKMGEDVDDQLAFTYFYPTINEKEVNNFHFPWYNWDDFSWKYLGSYVSTALQKGRGAEEGSLHEIEFISPITRDDESVFLIGYIFEKEGCTLLWKDVLNILQLGGERGYGWGRVEHLPLIEIKINETIFGLEYMNNQKTNRPHLIVPENTKLFAHTYADNLNAIGTIEPVVGRETDQLTGNFGKNCSSAQICWTPESKIKERVSIQIEKKGLWRKCN